MLQYSPTIQRFPMVHISATRCPQSDGQQPTFSEPSSSWTCPSLRLGSERRSSIVMRSSPCHSFSSHKHAPFSTGAARQLYLVKFRYLALLVFENVKNGFMICGAALTVFFYICLEFNLHVLVSQLMTT